MVESKHFNDYDLLRIFAILFVVIGHSAYTIINGDYGGVNNQLPQNLAPAYNGWLLSIQRYLAGWVYGFHMPLFFILSGAVYAISDSYSYDTLCKKKLKRLFMPYWLYGLGFMIPVKWLANFYDNHTANVAYVNLLGGERRSFMVPVSLVLGIYRLLDCTKNIIRQSVCYVPDKSVCSVLS